MVEPRVADFEDEGMIMPVDVWLLLVLGLPAAILLVVEMLEMYVWKKERDNG